MESFNLTRINRLSPYRVELGDNELVFKPEIFRRNIRRGCFGGFVLNILKQRGRISECIEKLLNFVAK